MGLIFLLFVVPDFTPCTAWNNLGVSAVLICAIGISLPILFVVVENRFSSRQQSNCFRAEQET
jgi:hypothetical protein